MNARVELNSVGGGVGNTIRFPDGSAATPSITFANDDTTGLFLVAAGRLGVAASGSQVAEFDTTSIDFFGTTITFTAAGNITARSDTDGTFILGRSRIDNRVSDFAFFSHFDQSGTGSFAVRQSAAGQTVINAATASSIIFAINGSGNAVYNASGNFAVGSLSPSGKIHADQSSTTAAIPALFLNQADVSEEFIRFQGTSAAANLTNSLVRQASVGGNTLVAWAKVFVTDTSGGIAGAFFVPLYTLV